MYECLSCEKDSSLNNILINDLNTLLNTENVSKLSDTEINFLTNKTYLNVQFNIARKQFRLAEYIGLENTTVSGDVAENRRKVIVLLLQSRSIILNNSSIYGSEFQKNVLQNVSYLQKSTQQIRLLTKETLNKFVSNSIQKNALPLSQYFHMYFDVRWLVLTLQYVCNRSKESINDILNDTLLDLIIIAQNIYIKQEANSSPFICPCIKQFWIALEFLIGFVYGNNSEFWNIFNKLLEEHDELFTLWLLYNLASLRKYTLLEWKNHLPVEENGYIIEKKLKSIVVNNSQYISKALQILEPLITDLWLENAKLNIYQLLWDYFFKQLNILDTNIADGVTNFIESITGLASKQSSSSYELFIHMMLIHLRKHTSHWPKLKGRIYSRFPVQKVSELNVKGIYNICLLFLRLADVYFEELVEKMEELLKNISIDKIDELVFKIHISLVAKYIYHEKELENMSSTLVCLLEEASQNRMKYNLIKIVITGYDYILNMSNNYHLKQYKLLGAWVSKYVACCQYGDLCYFVNILTWTVEKLQKTDAYFEWMPTLITFILPAMKQVAATSNAPPQSGRLIALIIQEKPSLISQFVVTFTNDTMNPKVVNQFLCSLLEDYPVVQIIASNDELLIIRAWVRCALLSSEISVELTKKIFKFDYLSILHINEISQDPLLTLIKAFGKQSQSSSDCKLKEICQNVFGHINQVLTQTISKNPSEITLQRIYNYISSLYFHCANLIYNNTKSNCLLSQITSTILLPTEILMGRPPNQIVLKAIENTWPIFMESLFKLCYSSDPYIERTLRDLVTKYVPHFSPTESPILKCLNKEDVLAFILDKIATTFLNNSAKASEENMFKALKTVEIIIQFTNEEAVMKLLVRKILPGILEIIMFNSNKAVAINVLKSVALSEWYIHIRYDIRKAVQTVMEKHLAFAAHHFFQLFTILIKLIPDDAGALIPILKKQISVVERMRGVGFDNTLRTGLDRIESLMM